MATEKPKNILDTKLALRENAAQLELGPSGVPRARPRYLELKETQREQVRLRLSKLDPDWILKTSRAIQDRLIALDEFKRARVVGCYLALPSEVQTSAIVAACRKASKRLCVPAYRPKKRDYGMCWYAPGETTVIGPWGIAEPVNREFMAASEIDIMVVPCLAFDEHGRRLGHGGGHFDRLLAGASATNICLAFECQKLTAVPAEDHDVEVDLVVTERAVHRAE